MECYRKTVMLKCQNVTWRNKLIKAKTVYDKMHMIFKCSKKILVLVWQLINIESIFLIYAKLQQIEN